MDAADEQHLQCINLVWMWCGDAAADAADDVADDVDDDVDVVDAAADTDWLHDATM